MAVVAPPGAAWRPPSYCTVPEASQERVRYASAPGCPGRRRASLALTDLHTDNSACAALRRNKQRLRYTYDALPPRVAGDLRGIHNRTRLRRRIDAGGPLAGPPSRPGAPKGLPCCSPEASGEQFLWYNGGFVNFAPQREGVCDRDPGLRLFRILPNLCKKPGQKTPVRSLFAVEYPGHLPPLTMPPAGEPGMPRGDPISEEKGSRLGETFAVTPE